MTRTEDTLEAIARIALVCRTGVREFDAMIAWNAEPSMAGGSGRRAGISDPTPGAVQNAEVWLAKQRQFRADVVGIHAAIRKAERTMLAILDEAPVLNDRERMRASCVCGCGELASVNPKTQQADRKGFSLKCYFKDLRSTKPSHPIDSVLHEMVDTALGMGAQTQVEPKAPAAHFVYCSNCVTDYPVCGDPHVWLEQHKAQCGVNA